MIKTTGTTLLGAQHPAYDYRLSGQGELVLSQLGRRTATPRDLAYSGRDRCRRHCGPRAGAGRLAIASEVALSAEVIKRDGDAALLVVPTGWLGLVVSLH